MSWDTGERAVAQPTGAVISGARAAGGAELYVDVSFRTIEWPWKKNGPVSLVPQPCEVTARAKKIELKLGLAMPQPGSVLSPPSHSSTTRLRFILLLSRPALVALEEARDGGALELGMELVALPFLVTRYEEYAPGIDVRTTSTSYSFSVPKEQWAKVLQQVGFCETLITELQLPTSGPDSTAPARRRLAGAVVARNDGSYPEAMRRCRIALDELKNGGFGGKAPSDVAKFLQEKAGTMSSAERFSALKLALQLFLSPTHHANAPEEHYTREDAELAIAMTAALLRIAPTMDTRPEAALPGTERP